MIPPTWFIRALLLLNVGAFLAFGIRQQWAWALIYAGAALIQLGCLWALR